MARFLMTYIGGNPPATPEEGQAHFAKYQQWLGALGDSVESAMNPIKSTHSIQPDGQVSSEDTLGMSGFTILLADDIDAAVEMAKGCPFLDIGGTLEVSELVQMG